MLMWRTEKKKIDMYGEVLDTATIGAIPKGEEDKVFQEIQQTLEGIVREIDAGSLPQRHSIIQDMYQIMGKINAGRDIANIKRDMVISQSYYPDEQKYSLNASGETKAQSYTRELTGENEIIQGLQQIKGKPSLFPVNSQTIGENLADLPEKEFMAVMEARMAPNFSSFTRSNNERTPKGTDGLGAR